LNYVLEDRTVMGLTLDRIVPWGRSQAEYCQMFNLSDRDRQKNILDCGAGPASFCAEMTQQGARVIACDPIYQFSAEAIAQRIRDVYPVILTGVEAHLASYVWTEIPSPQVLGDIRMAAMDKFLVDFPKGLAQGRYLNESLPHLPFPDRQFDLALCSHFLLSYSDHLSWDFHQAAIQELLRVAQEVRIFPVLTISGERSPFLEPLIEQFSQSGYGVAVQKVAYEFQRGGNQMLCLKHPSS
jgi:SAM-dependent methyltransferase